MVSIQWIISKYSCLLWISQQPANCFRLLLSSLLFWISCFLFSKVRIQNVYFSFSDSQWKWKETYLWLLKISNREFIRVVILNFYRFCHCFSVSLSLKWGHMGEASNTWRKKGLRGKLLQLLTEDTGANLKKAP